MTTMSDDLPSLYDITGKITDHNTLLINRGVLRQLEMELEQYKVDLNEAMIATRTRLMRSGIGGCAIQMLYLLQRIGFYLSVQVMKKLCMKKKQTRL